MSELDKDKQVWKLYARNSKDKPDQFFCCSYSLELIMRIKAEMEEIKKEDILNLPPFEKLAIKEMYRAKRKAHKWLVNHGVISKDFKE